MVGRLLVCEGETEEPRLVPRPPEELQARRQSVSAREAHRDGNCRKAGARRKELVVVAARRVEVADETRRIAPGRIDHRVEALIVHELEHRRAQLHAKFVAGHAPGALARDVVGRLSRFEAHLDRRVEVARLDHVGERMHRRLVAESGEIAVQVVLELIAAAALRAPQHIEVRDGDRIDHLGAEIAQLADRAAKHVVDLSIERRRVVRLMQHAEARASETVGAQRGRVVRVDMAAARRGDRIVWIVAGNHLQHRRRIGHGARHRTGDGGGEIERHDAGPADQAHRRSQADEGLMSGRPADRVAGVARQPDRGEVRRQRGRRSAARSGRHAARVVGIARVAGKNRIDRLDRAERELRHVRLGEHHGAGCRAGA